MTIMTIMTIMMMIHMKTKMEMVAMLLMSTSLRIIPLMIMFLRKRSRMMMSTRLLRMLMNKSQLQTTTALPVELVQRKL